MGQGIHNHEIWDPPPFGESLKRGSLGSRVRRWMSEMRRMNCWDNLAESKELKSLIDGTTCEESQCSLLHPDLVTPGKENQPKNALIAVKRGGGCL